MSMTNSEPPASPEEKWTAYLDGRLSAQDAATFEREHPEALAEREMHARIISAVRLHSPAPKLRNADFFNERILREISPASAAAPKPARSLFPLWRLAFASASCLLISAGIYVMFVRGHEGKPDDYRAEIVSVRAGDNLLDATVMDADGVAVVWIDGLDQLPNDYVLE
jgi:hypothetical protein